MKFLKFQQQQQALQEQPRASHSGKGGRRILEKLKSEMKRLRGTKKIAKAKEAAAAQAAAAAGAEVGQASLDGDSSPSLSLSRR